MCRPWAPSLRWAGSRGRWRPWDTCCCRGLTGTWLRTPAPCGVSLGRWGHHRGELGFSRWPAGLCPEPWSIFLWPGVHRVGPFATGDRRDVGTVLSAQRTSSPIPGVKVTANRTPSHPCRRGSPLLIGVRSEYKLSTEEVPVLYMTRKSLQEDRHVWVAHTWHQIQKVLRQLSLGSVFSKSFFTLDALHQYPQAQGMACCSGTCRQPARVPAVIWRVLFAAA